MLRKVCLLTSCSGSVHLPEHFPFLGDTQLKVLAVLGAVSFIATHGILAFAVTEQRLLVEEEYVLFFLVSLVVNWTVV